MKDQISVLLTTEGTYPFHQGGVSTWCDILVNKLPSVRFVVYSVLMNPFVTQKFKLPEQAGIVRMPLWGTEEPSEHLTTPFSQIYSAKRKTNEAVVRTHFLPLFQQMIEEIVAPVKDPDRFANVLLGMYVYFQEYEYKKTFKSETVWEAYKAFILHYAANDKNKMAPPDVYGMVQSLGWLYRFFNILNTPVPDVQVTHSSAAAFCGIPCVIAKLLRKTPYMLTEHGVYLREQYLSLSKQEYASFLNTFLIRFVNSITSLNYAMADQVSPVCEYNTRWELQFGVNKERIKVIYNGVDKRVFAEAEVPRNPHPTVVTVARIDPNKDILTLIRSAAIVRDSVPDVKFVIYGSVSVPEYYEECLELRSKLDLNETIIFAGHTYNMAAAYASADIIALSSTSEAFPYSIVEAMMTGRPVVATDVGGVREALGDCGILVRPCAHDELARGIVRLIGDPGLRMDMAKDARERALNFFSLEKVLELHLKSYIMLALGVKESKPEAIAAADETSTPAARRQLHARRGYDYLRAGRYREAIGQFRLAVKADPASPAAPVWLAEMAEAYNKLGEFDAAFAEMEKIRLIIELHRPAQSA